MLLLAAKLVKSSLTKLYSVSNGRSEMCLQEKESVPEFYLYGINVYPRTMFTESFLLPTCRKYHICQILTLSFLMNLDRGFCV